VVQLLESAFVSKPASIPLPRSAGMPYTGLHRASERMKPEPYTTPLLNPSSQMLVPGATPINVSGPISHVPVKGGHSLVTVGGGRDSRDRTFEYPRREQGTVA